MKKIALLALVSLSFTFMFSMDFMKLSFSSHDIQLTTHGSLQDLPSLIGLSDRYYVAYQSWETGESYNGDIFIEVFDLSWDSIKKVRVTAETSYQDSPSLVYDDTYLYVLYISNENGPYNVFVKTYDTNLNFIYKEQITNIPYPQDRPSALLIFNEYFYVAYQSWETGESYNGDIFIEVFDLSWDSIKKVRVTAETSYQDSPSLCYADESIYVAYVSSETGDLDIFVKRYDLYLEVGYKFQLTNDPSTQDLPSLNTVITETYWGFSLAYQSWETGASNNGDIFVKYFNGYFDEYDKVRITCDKYYEDSPSITSETIYRHAYVAYVSNKTGNWDIFASPIKEAPCQYVLIITSTVGGQTNPSEGTYFYDDGTVVPVIALPLSGYNFSRWELNEAVYYNDVIEVIMDRNYTLKAVFSQVSSPFDEIVVEEIIVPENLTTDLIAFRWPEPLQPGDVITASVADSGLGYEPNRTVWFYWINDCPYAGYAHETRYVFVEEETGDCEIFVEEWPPMLNGDVLWEDPEEYWDPENWIWSTTNYTQISHEISSSASWIESKIGSAGNVESQSAKRALIIEGYDHPRSSPSKPSSFQNASELWYDLFKDFGYSDQEIVYLTPESRQNEYEIDYTCTRQNVATAIQSLTSLDDGSLIVFIAAHGKVEYWNNLTGYIELVDGYTLLYDHELTQHLGKIANDTHITVIMQSCYCGSFMDDLWTLNNVDTIVTSTDWKSVSYMASAGMDPPLVYGGIPGMTQDPNLQDEGGEFSSGMRKGLDDSWQSYIGGSITLGELYVEAYKEGIELDAGYINRETLANKYGSNYTPNPLMKTIFFPGDIDLSFWVNIVDISIAARAFGTRPGDEYWDPIADMDRNRWINVVDISVIAREFGKTY